MSENSSVGANDALLRPSPHGMSEAAFVARFGGVYEHSPWIAEGAHRAGLGAEHAAPERLAEAMAAIVDAADHDRRLGLLKAHPELAGKLAIAKALTEDSASEQASAGLDQCSPEEFAAFQELNTRYGARFGHPFIIAVRGLSRAEILDTFRARVENDAETEFRTAIDQVHRIARLRLAQMAGA